MRGVRTVVGVLGLLVALAVLLIGVGLATALAHRDAAGAFTAELDPVPVEGHAVVVTDVDGLLRRDAAFARGGPTVLRVSGGTATGPAFVGLASAAAVARYLGDVPHTQLTEVRLTRGPLPVRFMGVPGGGRPATPPGEQPFWIAAAAGTAVEWTPSAVRGQQLALVVMNVDGSPPSRVDLRASVVAGWLSSTTWGVLILGAVLLGLALVTLCWPERPREIVYVMEPAPPVLPQIPRPAPEPAPDQAALPPLPPLTVEFDWPPARSPVPGTPGMPGARGAPGAPGAGRGRNFKEVAG